MVSLSLQPKDFFIYGNGKKLWVVFGDTVLDIKDYMIDSFNFTVNQPMIEQQLIGGDTFSMAGRREMEFDLHAIVTDAIVQNKEGLDVSDFYDMEECKNLSKIIQRKFDKILEVNNEENK